MATKAKSGGAAETTATATKKAKSETGIEKPKTQLREPLQHKKDLFEQIGWEITEIRDGWWTAEKQQADDQWKFGELKIVDLFIEIFLVEEKDFISHLNTDESLAMLEWRAKGWIFAEPEFGMWEATKGKEYCGRHSMLRALFSQVEGTETGDHKAAIEKMIAETVATRKEMLTAEGWRFVEVKDPDGDYWTATNGSPAFPDFTGAELSDIFKSIESCKKENRETIILCQSKH